LLEFVVVVDILRVCQVINLRPGTRLGSWCTQVSPSLTRILSSTYFYPYRSPVFLKGNKSTRTSVFRRYKKDLAVPPLLKQLKILTIQERLEWTCLKNAFRCVKYPDFDVLYFYEPSPRASRTFPLLQVPSGRTKFIGRSVKFRTIQLWNVLPKSWNLMTLKTHTFKQQVHDHLVSRRKNCFVKF